MELGRLPSFYNTLKLQVTPPVRKLSLTYQLLDAQTTTQHKRAVKKPVGQHAQSAPLLQICMR